MTTEPTETEPQRQDNNDADWQQNPDQIELYVRGLAAVKAAGQRPGPDNDEVIIRLLTDYVGLMREVKRIRCALAELWDNFG